MTDRGRALLASHPERITLDDLSAYEEFRDFRARSRTATGTETTADTGGSIEAEDAETPLEQIAAAVAHLDATVAAELVERIQQQPPEFLEKAVLRLLVAMGYGGSATAAQHLGGSGDGGFDGVITRTVSASNASTSGQAVCLTTSWVSQRYRPVGALHHAELQAGCSSQPAGSPRRPSSSPAPHPRVILIDGTRLRTLISHHGVGIQERQVFASSNSTRTMSSSDQQPVAS